MITVGIKALNEERNIAAAIESALCAVAPFAGRVVLADSGSIDNTIKIASNYPIKIVQLSDSTERCCGAGAQLAYQHAEGEYFYLLDGDMVLHPNFLNVGISLLEKNQGIAAVGGKIIEKNVEGQDFAIRADKASQTSNAYINFVDRLDCGGLYRTKAIQSVKYFADRNLHSFEEFELGTRLRVKGWKLARLSEPAVDHYGHLSSGYKLLWRRLVSGYSGGAGEVFRSALGKENFGNVVLGLAHLPIALAIFFWWSAVTVLSLKEPSTAVVIFFVPILFLIFRRKSFRLGIYSFVSWNLSAISTILGGMRPRQPPSLALASNVLADKSEEFARNKV